MAKMNVNHRRVQFLTAASFFVNVMFMIYLRNNSAVPSIIPDVSALSRVSRYAVGTPTPLTGQEEEEPSGCRKSIIFFGIRHHWFTFCNYDVFSQYKYMIQFPRSVDCDLNCSVTVHHTMEPSAIKGHDIVVFTDVDSWITPPMWDWAHGNRTEGQIWTMVTEESPLYVPGVTPPEKYADTTFDWMDSYRSDADFFHPYGSYEKYTEFNRPAPTTLHEFLTNKRSIVSWMGSHCETLQWDRKRFVEALAKIINVDTYGRCGAKGEIPWNNDTVIQETLGSYKFYLSLENSCCDEYITEKFWRALEMGMVPVVMGAPLEHYNKFAPPESFIHVDNYDSITDLAVHLLKLSSDDEAYLKYHRWRNEGRLISYGQEEQYVRPLNNETQCALVSKLLKTDVSKQTKFRYFGEKWYGSCKTCGSKGWLKEFMHPENHERNNTNIWA